MLMIGGCLTSSQGPIPKCGATGNQWLLREESVIQSHIVNPEHTHTHNRHSHTDTHVDTHTDTQVQTCTQACACTHMNIDV